MKETTLVAVDPRRRALALLCGAFLMVWQRAEIAGVVAFLAPDAGPEQPRTLNTLMGGRNAA
jgi:hypothetical protein